MSEIKFIHQFGDELERRITADSARQRPTTRQDIWTRLRALIRGHKPLAIILVAITVAGCATAILISNPAQTTVAYGIRYCHDPGMVGGLGGNAPAVHYGSMTLVGADVFSADPLTACSLSLAVPRSRLIACVKPKVGIQVYIKTGDPEQCERLHLQPFGPKYRQALRQMASLNLAVIKLDYSRVCWKPSALARAVNTLLSENQFVGWHASVESGQEMAFAGPCGSVSTAAMFPNMHVTASTLLLDPRRHIVPIYYGAPTPVLIAATDVYARMQTASIDEILTLRRLSTLILHTFEHDAPHYRLRLVLQLSTLGRRQLKENGSLSTYEQGGALFDIEGIGSVAGQRPVNGVYTLEQIGFYRRNLTVAYTYLGSATSFRTTTGKAAERYWTLGGSS